MKNRILSMLLAIVMVVGLVPGFTVTASAASLPAYSGGSGTNADPYLLATADDLVALRTALLDDDGSLDAADACGLGGYHGYYFKLANDIDMYGVEWEAVSFCGNLDGDGHSIKNLSVQATNNDDGEYWAAMFAQLINATVTNITFDNCSATADNTAESSRDVYVSIVAANAIASKLQNISIKNCTLTINRYAPNFGYAGFISALADITNITGCNVSGGSISAEMTLATNPVILGGITGCFEDLFYEFIADYGNPYNMTIGAGSDYGIYDCSVNTTITSAANNTYAAGIVGMTCTDYWDAANSTGVACEISNCFFGGELSATGTYGTVAGISRWDEPEDKITDCIVTATLTAPTKVSPLCEQPETVTNSYYLTTEADQNGGRTMTQFEEGAVCTERRSHFMVNDVCALCGYKVTYTITTNVSPTQGGTVTGGGTYDKGESVTVTATPATGYKFVKWIENDSEVSTSASYTFEADGPRALTAIFEEVQLITLNLESPRGLKETLEIDTNDTVADLKAAVAAKCNVSFGEGSEYRLFGADLSYPNSKLDDDTKVLKDIGFANDQTIHLEKSTNWDASGGEPIQIFGLTITGGKGSQEPYGDYTNVDYYWNYYYKTITIKSTANITISGTGEPNTNIIIKKAGSNSYTNLTISDLHLTTDAGACINVQGNSWVKLTVKGNNTLTATGEAAQYTVDEMPALTLTNSGAYLKIMSASTGTLTATTNIAGQPGIGTYDNTSSVWGVEINGGTIIANGGEGAAGIRAQAVCIYGGNVTANGGIDGYGSNNLYPYSIEILGGTVTASSESGKALTAVPNLDSYQYHTATASVNADGTASEIYDSTKNDSYKYFKIEPRTVFTVAVDSAIENGTVVADKASSEKDGTITLTVTPDTGYVLDNLKYNNGNKDTSITGTSFTMPAADIVVTAVFKPFAYSIGYTLNGGDASNPATYTIEAETFTLTNPTKTGYTFKGWSGNDLTGDENQTVTITKGSMGNRTYTANWTANTYTVKFDANGGTGTMADQVFTYDVAQGLSANAFTYTNKYFTGWKDGNDVSYTAGQNVKNLTAENGGTVTLYAQWSDKPAQAITFDTTDRTATYGDGALEERRAAAEGAITYSSSDETVAAVDADGVVTVLKAGTTTITASAAETAGYAAGSASYTLTVAPKALTITVTDKSAYAGSQKPDLSAAEAGKDYTVDGLVDGDTVTVTLSYATEPDMTKSGEYAITAAGTDASGNYTFNVVDGKLTVSNRPSSGSSSNTTTKTEKNEDGSTTTTTTNKTTGTVTETTKYPDGSTTTVETKKDGSTTETSKTSGGTTGTVVTDKTGTVTEVSAKVPASAAKDAEQSGEAVKLPVEVETADDTNKAVEIEVDVPNGGVTVEIPVEDVTSGTVVVIVNKDGTEEIVKTATVTESGVVVALDKDATIKVIDNSKHFVDVHPVDHWAEEAVDFVVARTIYSGTSATTFHPDNPMTRGMLAVVLHNLEDNPDHAFDGFFHDVAEGSWYEDAIHWAADEGIVGGYGNGNYGPNDNITREQLAVMLWRYAGSPDSDHSLDHFTDAHLISDYAETALAWANENGIINGKGGGILDPKGDATRAQVAQMLMNYLKTVL